MAVKFHKVTSLPGTLDADAFYYVENGTYAEAYVTNSAAVARSIGNSAMITSIANALITTALGTLNTLEIVADITARNALSTSNRNLMVLVIDATGDATVTSGAALYAFRNSDDSWHKLSEFEGLDVAVAWANISGKPTSSPALIDAAVTSTHTHSNKTFLDKIGETGGALTYDGALVSNSWTTTNW